jgi:hypothetical protein
MAAGGRLFNVNPTAGAEVPTFSADRIGAKVGIRVLPYGRNPADSRPQPTGRFETLTEVIEHCDDFLNLELSDDEQYQLAEFLKSL